jgi:pyruvate dehydrogenase complex dehydrogenase (E1) component
MYEKQKTSLLITLYNETSNTPRCPKESSRESSRVTGSVRFPRSASGSAFGSGSIMRTVLRLRRFIEKFDVAADV